MRRSGATPPLKESQASTRCQAVYRVLWLFSVSPSQASFFFQSSECRPQKRNQKGSPLHPDPASRDSPRSIVASGAGAMGHPWPGAPLAASMPLVPLRNDCARPPEGAGSLPHALSHVRVHSALRIHAFLPRDVEPGRSDYKTLENRGRRQATATKKPPEGGFLIPLRPGAACGGTGSRRGSTGSWSAASPGGRCRCLRRRWAACRIPAR